MSDYAPEHQAFRFAEAHDEQLLEGVRVIDAGNLVASPFAAGLLADFGADVIKIEHPEYGDGLRQLAPHKDGVPLWWKMTGRNKRCVTLDLSTDEGAAVFVDLVETADVVCENYRPGTMERWGLGYKELRTVNPGVIMLRISGFGQTGPYQKRPGFGRIAGAMSGMTTLIGEADGPPMTPGYPLADSVSGIFGAFATMMALYHRDVRGGEGEEIDLALYESLFRMLEFYAIEYDQTEQVRRRTGNTHAYVSPSSTYETADGEYLTMTASTQNIWRRLCRAIEREELIDDPRFEDNAARVENSDEINGIVRDWVAEQTRDEIEARFDEYDVAYGFAYDIADIFDDEHYRERGSLVRVSDDELGEVVVQSVVPRMRETPGSIDHLGPRKGQHNEDVYRDELGYSAEKVDRLREAGVI